jgi:hypothetical protein
VVILRANGSTPFRRTQKQNLPFPFSKKMGGEKKDKNAKAKF